MSRSYAQFLHIISVVLQIYSTFVYTLHTGGENRVLIHAAKMFRHPFNSLFSTISSIIFCKINCLCSHINSTTEFAYCWWPIFDSNSTLFIGREIRTIGTYHFFVMLLLLYCQASALIVGEMANACLNILLHIDDIYLYVVFVCQNMSCFAFQQDSAIMITNCWLQA